MEEVFLNLEMSGSSSNGKVSAELQVIVEKKDIVGQLSRVEDFHWN